MSTTHNFMKSARRGHVDATPPEGSTLVDMLRSRSGSFPDRLAFRFLEDDHHSTTISYGELDESARRIGASLQERFDPGSNVALVFPPGLDFVKAFFGCAYAGVLPVPATYPKPRRPSARLSAIVADARPSAILTTQRVMDTLADSTTAEGLHKQSWLSCEELDRSSPTAWQQPTFAANDIAFLQYTSGSTKDPRGVAVTHDNIAYNLEMIRQGFGLSQETARVGVSWLPAYHDMGLIGGILESLYVGGTTILMPPLSFLQRPARWLRAISEHQAVISGGPNFAYELCIRKIKPAEMEGLDLSSWRVAFSGAEPIRAGTLQRFAEVFASCGFSESAFYPCYGLAEATLLVAGGNGPGKITTCSVQAAELQENGRAVPVEPQSNHGQLSIELVGCGSPLLAEEVLIVDAKTRLPCDENVVGEIWIRGRNVARGYRDRVRETASTFNAHLANSREEGFLRSGDLGFLRDGSLFVTGRRKELLIIRGRNHYPHDLEATVQNSHERLIPGGGAAFLVDRHGDQILVLVQEVDRATSPSERESIIREIRRNVTAEHDVFVHEVILIRMGTLPRTTSGKVRYADVKRSYLDGDLGVITRWSFAQSERRPEQQKGSAIAPSSDLRQLLKLPKIQDQETLAEEIQTRLMTWLSQTTKVPEIDLEPNRPLAEYGLDSLAAMELIEHLETGLGLKLSPTIAWTYPTPELLARHLSELITSGGGGSSIKSSGSSSGNGSGSGVRPQSAKPAEDAFAQLLQQLEHMSEDQVAAMLASEDRPETAE